LGERDQLEKFSGATYSADRISKAVNEESRAYFDVLLREKLGLVRGQPSKRRVLDLGCATGEHLLHLAPELGEGIGLDFSRPYLERAQENRKRSGAGNVRFVQGNARRLPFHDGAFDVVYSFSSLYCMPDLGEVIAEITRVLSPGGRGILDMGNQDSLNTLVVRAHPELAHPYHMSVGRMEKLMCRAGLDVIEHRAFQILPLWGDRPGWLRPLLNSCWKAILQKPIGGRMLDEWISGMPLLNRLAFRHLFVVAKNAGKASGHV
jgi:ubiquinone/menaquinone biosynthesis C-methylase UbiE